VNAYELFNRLAAPAPFDSETERTRETLLELARATIVASGPAMTLAAMKYLGIVGLTCASETQLRAFIDLATE
jgi:hypothetical protein